MHLRYGLNPHQSPATLAMPDDPPFRIHSGEPSYINILDALNSWQLVRKAAAALNRPAATSFKHVSPAGTAIDGPLDAVQAETYRLDPAATGPLTSAYVRARDADPRASYGDFAAVSEPVDAELADLLRRVVCDGIIAPGFDSGVIATLQAKKGGRFLVLEADPDFRPPEQESREVFGIRLTQPRSDQLPDPAPPDLLLGAIALEFTQSNSVAYLQDGMALGIGAGQQSRIACTMLAGAKADTWWLRRHPKVRGLDFLPAVRRHDRVTWQLRLTEGELSAGERARLRAAVRTEPEFLSPEERHAWLGRRDGLSLASDGAIPFRDNIDEARRHGVRHIIEPGDSGRSGEVAAACAERGITLVRTGTRLFHH
ncbi:MAG TPA: phosphoribosylaminoimidazolecarboxamide formyltransferase [Mycobacteriales bacterium]|nr:phosphoribosylaminoimidazolecarboxamide formyltransferase [Mycobacteriales bacterium]